MENCLNCEELRLDASTPTIICYECYILSGQEDKDHEQYESRIK